jgi:hypothetical protein
MLFEVIVFLPHACYQRHHPSNLVDIPPPLAPLFFQRTYKGAPVLCLPSEGSDMAVPSQDQPKKSEYFCVSARGDISPPAPPHSTTLHVLPFYLIARGGGGIIDVIIFI